MVLEISELSRASENFPGMKERHNAIDTQRIASTRDEYNAESALSSIPIRPEPYSCQTKPSDHATSAEGQLSWHVNDAQRDCFNSTNAHLSLDPLATHEHVALQPISRYDPVTYSEAHRYQIYTIPAHDNHECMTWKPHHELSITTNPVLEAFEGPSNGQYPQLSPKDAVLSPRVWSHDYLENMWQPLQDCFLGLAHKDPWSPLRPHSTLSPHLVLSHTRCEGYDFFPTSENVDTDVAPLSQQNSGAVACGITHIGAATGNEEHAPSSEGTPSMFPSLLTPVSSNLASNSGPISERKQDTTAQSSMLKSIPESAQIAWDSKTGEPLGSAKTKRPQSKEERLSSLEIRRLGGPCVRCRMSHRKVTKRNALLSYLH